MNIKTIISLRKKINNLSFNLNNFNIFEKGIMFFFAISCFFAFLLFLLHVAFTLERGNILLSILFFNSAFLFIPLLIHFFSFVSKFLLRKKSKLFNSLFSNLLEGFRFNTSKYINESIESLTEEETKLLLEVINIKKHEKKSINDILEDKILTFSKTANQTNIDFILDSIDNKELRHKIFEVSQVNKKQELNIVKQKIIKSI